MAHCMVCERDRAGTDFLTRTIDALQEALGLAPWEDVSEECAAELRQGIKRMLRNGESRGGEWSKDPWGREETMTKAAFLDSVVREMRQALEDAPPNQGVCEVCSSDLRGAIMRMLVYDESRKGPYSKIRK